MRPSTGCEVALGSPLVVACHENRENERGREQKQGGTRKQRQLPHPQCFTPVRTEQAVHKVRGVTKRRLSCPQGSTQLRHPPQECTNASRLWLDEPLWGAATASATLARTWPVARCMAALGQRVRPSPLCPRARPPRVRRVPPAPQRSSWRGAPPPARACAHPPGSARRDPAWPRAIQPPVRPPGPRLHPRARPAPRRGPRRSSCVTHSGK